MPKLIAVDLGSHSVKLAVYEGAFGRFQFERLVQAPVPQDALPDPEDAVPAPPVADPAAEDDTEAALPAALPVSPAIVGMQVRMGVLSRLLDELGELQRPAFVAGWPSERASLRHVRLPFGDKAQVEKVLPFEVEGLVPFSMDEMELRSRILQLEPGDSQVLVAVVEREGLQTHIARLQEAGADPRSLDVDADLLSEIAPDRGVQAVVDIGHQRVIVTLVRDGAVVAARALDGGGRTLTLALADAFDLSWDEAEARKHAASLDDALAPAAAPVTVEPSEEWEGQDPTQPGVETPADAPPSPRNLRPVPPPRRPAAPAAGPTTDAAVLRDAFLPQLAELRSTLIAFEDSLEVDIDEVVITGGGSALGGLRDLLGKALGVPVRRLDLGAGPLGDAVATRDCPDAWALAAALGIRGTRGKQGSMDLRQGSLAFRGDLYIVRQVGLYAGVFAACALLAGTAMFGWRSYQLRSELAAIDTEIRDLVVEAFPEDVSPDRIKTGTDALAIATEKSLEATTRVEMLGAIVSDEPPTVSLLRQLSEGMPPPEEARVDITELTMTSSSITLEAETDGYEAATRIESSLQANPRFSGARKGDEKKRRTGDVQFKITIPRNTEGDGEEG